MLTDSKSQVMRTQSKTLSVPQAGEILGISRNSAYEAAKKGEIPIIRIGRLIRVPIPALERMLGCAIDVPDENNEVA